MPRLESDIDVEPERELFTVHKVCIVNSCVLISARTLCEIRCVTLPSNVSGVTIHLCKLTLQIYSIKLLYGTLLSRRLEIYQFRVIGNASVHCDVQ